MSDNQTHHEHYDQKKNLETSCERIVHQCAKISLPVEIAPFAVAGRITTRCCGNPTVSIRECKNTCHYIITQEVCIDIPVKFGALTETKNTHIECEKPEISDIK